MMTSLPETYVKRIISFQKAAFESSFNFVSMMQEQAERTIQSAVGQVPWIPDEGKLLMEQWVGALQEGRATFQKVVRDGFDHVADTLARQVSETARGAASWTAREARQGAPGDRTAGSQESDAERKAGPGARKRKATD